MSESERVSRPRIAVIYHMFPHYRAPVLRALSKSDRYHFDFFGSHEPVDGIEVFTGDDQVEVKPIGYRAKGVGGVMSGLWGPVFDRRYSALILIGNPHYLQTWMAAIIGRLTGKAILFWTHGWLRREGGLKSLTRRFYFNLADLVLVYADRARDLATQAGFSPSKVVPIYNSLDWDLASTHFEVLEKSSPTAERAALGLSADRPILICTARLTPLCRFDLLLQSARMLTDGGRPVQVVLVGGGPMRDELERQAAALGVDAIFTGAIYDEATLSRLIYAADVTVSPGKIGLTAVHSLSYGTPVVTHGDLDKQMPEVEAITPHRTGEFFQPDDAVDLARAISNLLDWPQDRATIRSECRIAIGARYTPLRQRMLIERALDSLPRLGRRN